MGRTKEQQREYMAKYRARKRDLILGEFVTDLDRQGLYAGKWAATRIAELEEEVRHLKEELAKRPTGRDFPKEHAAYDREFNTRPFTPVPKKGK